MKGTINKIFQDKGFGFIKSEDGSSLFFHVKEIAEGEDFNSYEPGQEVTFEAADSAKGPKAIKVALVR